jgi:hypothetical protein
VIFGTRERGAGSISKNGPSAGSESEMIRSFREGLSAVATMIAPALIDATESTPSVHPAAVWRRA